MCWRNLTDAVLANGRRCLYTLWTRSRIQPMQAVRALMPAPPAQTCFGYARCDSAIRLESQPPEKRRLAAARERFLQMLALALLAISNDAAPIPRSRRKMFFLEKATRTHRPAAQRHLTFGFAGQSQRKSVAIFEARYSNRAFPQFFRRRARPSANFENVLAQLRARQKPRKQLFSRHPPPDGRSAKPILKPIHGFLPDTIACRV